MDPSTIYLMFGISRINKPTEFTIARDVTHIVLHEEFNEPILQQNDIAILKLDEPVKESTHVKIPQMVSQPLGVGTYCTVTGWGKSSPSAVWNSKDLLAVSVPILPTALCNSSDWHSGTMAEGQICAGFESGQKDACSGDSGGSLMCSNLLGGLVSWGDDCGVPKKPGVYTDIFHYLTWIKTTIDKLS